MDPSNMIPHHMLLHLLDDHVKNGSALFLVDNIDSATRLSSSPIVVSVIPAKEESALFFQALTNACTVTCTSTGEVSIEFKLFPNLSFYGVTATADHSEQFNFYPQDEDEQLYHASEMASFDIMHHPIPVMTRVFKCNCTLNFETLPVREVSDR